MAITFVASSGTPHAASNANGTPTMPAGVADNDLLFFVQHVSDIGSNIGTFSTPSGYTNLGDWTHAASAPFGERLRVDYRFFVSGDTAPATNYTGGGTGDCVLGIMTAFRGVDTTTPIDQTGTLFRSGSTQQNIGAITGITPAVNDACVLVWGGKQDDCTSIATLSGDSLTWGEAFEHKSTLGNDGTVVLGYAIISGSPVTVTSKTFTVTGGAVQNSIGIMHSLKPAGAAAATIPILVMAPPVASR